MAQVSMLSDEWLSRYGLLENLNIRIAIFEGVLDFNLQPHPLDWTQGLAAIFFSILGTVPVPVQLGKIA